MQICKYKMVKKSVSILLTLIFVASQVYAGPVSANSSRDTLATSVISDPDINPPRSTTGQSNVADQTQPGAIGDGPSLVALLKAPPPRAVIFEDEAAALVLKVRQAMRLALTKALERRDRVPQAYQGELTQAIQTLQRMLDSSNKEFLQSIYLFNAKVIGDEDYLLGFNHQGKIGLSVELISSLPLHLLAQYIFHETMPEREMVKRVHHRQIYTEIQSQIFGDEKTDEVLELKLMLRSFINIKLGKAPASWPNPDSLPPEKRVVMLISGGESAGVNNYFALMAKKLAEKGYSLELVQFGLDGLVKGPKDFNGPEGAVRDVNGRKGVLVWCDAKRSEAIMDMPGAAEGTARVKLNDPKHPEYLPNAVANLKGYCKTLIMIGGNDHLGEAGKIAKQLKDAGVEMVVVALPKTIDYDTKVYPIGAESAGFHAHDMTLRAAPLPGSNRCVVEEMMGRDMGWLTVRAGDMRPDAHAGYAAAQRAKMALVAPTIVMVVPEYPVSLASIVEAVKARMNKYGAATVLVSEGYRLSPRDPLLALIRAKNPLIDARMKQLDKLLELIKSHQPIPSDLRKEWLDAQDNLMLNKVGISDIVAAALAMELGDILKRRDSLVREVGGYAFRARMPVQGGVDTTVAEAATTEAVRVITDEAKRQDVLKDGGVCIATNVGAKLAEDVAMKIEPVASPKVQGKTDLRLGALYGEDTLRELGVLGVPGPQKELPELFGISAPQPVGKNIELAITSANSMAESARNMKRINLCVFPGDDADMLIDAVDPNNRKSIGRTDRYVSARTSAASIYIKHDDPLSLSEIVTRAYEVFRKHNFLSVIISGEFRVSESDRLLVELRNNEEANAIINMAERRDGAIVFGRKIVDLLAIALEKKGIALAAGVEFKEDDKVMSGVRTNILGELLNLLPGESVNVTDVPSAVDAESAVKPIEQATKRIKDCMKPQAGASFDLSKVVVIMKKGLPESIIGKKEGMVDGAVEQGYGLMEQHLRRLFPDRVLEVESPEDLAAKMNQLIRQHYKVIVLYDETIKKGFDTKAVEGKAGEAYCAVAANKMEKRDNLTMPFVNLNAMAMIGVGLLYKDTALFERAYEAFTGDKAPRDLVDEVMNKARWIVSMLPRIVRFTDEIRLQEQLSRLVAAAA